MHGRPAFKWNFARWLLVSLMLMAGRFGGSARAADLAKEILTSDTAQNYTDVIRAYVVGRAADLRSPDPAKVRSARDSLVENLRGLTAPTASFSDTYCRELVVALLPLTTSPDPRVRLNVAIVTEHVAERTQEAGFRLEQILLPELKDVNDGIVLWAMQASRYVLVPVLNVSGTGSKLMPAILDAAEKTTSGAVVGAAYAALSGDTTAATLPIYVTAVSDLLKFRIQQYAIGKIPPEPPMDARGTNFLTVRSVWISKGSDKTQTVQKIVDLITYAAAALPAAQGVDKDELALLLSSETGAIQAISITEGNQAMGTAMVPLQNAAADSRMTPDTLNQTINSALATVLQTFPGVHKPQAPRMSTATSHPIVATTAPSR